MSKFVYTDERGGKTDLERFDYEDYQIDKGLCNQLEFLKVFDNGGKRYEHPLLDLLLKATLDWEAHKEVAKDPNQLILWHWTRQIEAFEPEWKYKNAFINWARLNCILFQENPYWRSRMGHLLWWPVNYANQDSYYILKWEYHNDPRAWYKPGEPRRKQDLPVHAEGVKPSTGS